MLTFRLTPILLVIALLSSSLGQSALWTTAFAQDEPEAITMPIPLANIVQVAVGAQHACALTAQGGVKCWGRNYAGQLGNGASNLDSSTPVDVVGLDDAVSIAVGTLHSCALIKAGGIKCWGDNSLGELGDGTTINRSTPVDVVGLASHMKSIAAGTGFTCAVTDTGGAKCWGNNSGGQLGDGTSMPHLTPIDVVGLSSGVATMTAGHFHTCALTNDGGAKCWGINGEGQLGDGTTTARLTPVDVFGLTAGVTALVAGGFHTCAILTTGYVECWGNNDGGQLGNGVTAAQSAPALAGLYSDITTVVAGKWHSCALTKVGGVKCWGNNTSGEVGDGAKIDRLEPVDIPGLSSGVISIEGGDAFTCAVTAQGGVKCWGSNDYGQLGDSMLLDRALPGDVFTIATCYALTLGHTGNGATPSATPNQSQGCPLNNFLPGTKVALLSVPAPDTYVQSWSGTQDNLSRDPVNLLTMPAADTSAKVTYGACRTLTTNHTGAGANPVAVPSQSVGCGLGKYAAGDVMTLVAAPAEHQRVEGWKDGAQLPGEGVLVNTLTMPNADSSVSVAYEPCFALVASIHGQGELLQATPTATTGCEASAYVAGQTVTLLAAPAAGWRISSWGGTANNGSTAVTNSVLMATTTSTVAVVYEPVDLQPKQQNLLFLPTLAR